MPRKKIVSPNGHESTFTPSPSGRFRVEHTPDGKRYLHMPEGTRLTMKKPAIMILERLQNDNTGRPEVPQVEVKYAGGRRGVEANPNDPEYIERYNEWRQEKHMRLMLGIVTLGIEERPPHAFVEDMRDLFPHYGDKQMQYIWVMSMLGDDDDAIGEFAEIITGQVVANEGDVTGAMDSFRS